jgi:hypothetical protein
MEEVIGTGEKLEECDMEIGEGESGTGEGVIPKRTLRGDGARVWVGGMIVIPLLEKGGGMGEGVAR